MSRWREKSSRDRGATQHSRGGRENKVQVKMAEYLMYLINLKLTHVMCILGGNMAPDIVCRHHHSTFSHGLVLKKSKLKIANHVTFNIF